MPNCQNLLKGEIARVKFLITVPDSIVSPLYVTPGKFTSDSLLYLKPTPVGDTATIVVGPRCSLSRLLFSQSVNSMTSPTPNPATGHAGLDISLLAPSSPELRIMNEAGQVSQTLLDGSRQMDAGAYHIDFDTRSLAAGTYLIQLQAGEYHCTKQFVVVR
jgi:hypothetical protein